MRTGREAGGGGCWPVARTLQGGGGSFLSLENVDLCSDNKSRPITSKGRYNIISFCMEKRVLFCKIKAFLCSFLKWTAAAWRGRVGVGIE